MVKRIMTILGVFLLLAVGGCDLAFSPTTPSNEVVRDPNKYRSAFETAWQYSTLSQKEKVYYGHLYTAVKDTEHQEASITIADEAGAKRAIPGVRVSLPDAALSKQQITALFEAFFRDNPQFFYLSRTYHLEGRGSGEKDILYDTLILEFSMGVAQRQTAITQLEQTVQALISSAPVTQDQYVRELYLHDQLALRCLYDQQAAEQPSDTESSAYTAYGALVEGNAVCEGYAKAMQLLLTRAGIPATVVSGVSLKTKEPHMWNLVKINGKTYHLDPTWNDSDTYLSHGYFNLTTAMVSLTHQIDENQSVIENCTASADNYFIRSSAYIDTYERQTIAQAIVQQVLNGNSIVQLQFAKGKLANGQLFLKNRSLVSQMVNPYLEEKGIALWDYDLWVDEEQRILTLVKT